MSTQARSYLSHLKNFKVKKIQVFKKKKISAFPHCSHFSLCFSFQQNFLEETWALAASNLYPSVSPKPSNVTLLVKMTKETKYGSIHLEAETGGL